MVAVWPLLTFFLPSFRPFSSSFFPLLPLFLFFILVGVAVTYRLLKVKKVFGDEADPFAGMRDVDSPDVVLENPLYLQPQLD
jgi:hypothetical protein